jgi:hypothetical protein
MILIRRLMMRELKFRAIISKNTTIYFTLRSLANPSPLFSIREIVKPWLLEGNKPSLYTGKEDRDKEEIYEDDIVKGDGYLLPNLNFIVKFGAHDDYEGYHEHDGFYLENNRTGSYPLNAEYAASLKIIGNIFKDLELVNGKDGEA